MTDQADQAEPVPDCAAIEAQLRCFAAQLQAEGHDPAHIVQTMLTLSVGVGVVIIGGASMAACLSELAHRCIDAAERAAAERANNTVRH